jgi:hypothetical protein
LRFLLVEAAQAAARIDPDWRRRYMHLAIRRHKKKDLTGPTLLEISGYLRGPRVPYETTCPRHASA